MIYLLEAQGISKSFPGVQALREVRLQVSPGEVLAVVGENGAGKSTLMKILGGVETPDSGTIRLDGREVQLHSVKQAERQGIVLIHQELNLAEQLDVAGNIFLGREPSWGGPLRLLHGRIYGDAARIMDRLGLSCSPRAVVSSLSLGQQQLVEIARALSLRSRLLILDEPTSSLTERETAQLFGVIRELKKDGISVVYISHRLREVEEIADRVTVLRDGGNAGELGRGQIGHDAMVRLMVGRELKQFVQRSFTPEADAKPPLLEVRQLRWQGRQKQGVSLALATGEIVGVAGLMGAGRSGLAEALFGLRPWLSGEVRLAGQPIRIRRPAEAIGHGIFLVPEDRRSAGLDLAASVQRNISIASLPDLSRLGLVQLGNERRLAQGMCQRLGVRTPSLQQLVALLSGGNQQKVVLARWLGKKPRVLILDEPTRGIDVGAKSEIYALMNELASRGLALLIISSDLEEILGLSDRVLVMHEGRLAGQLPRAALSEEAIMHLATGGGVSVPSD